MPADLFHGFIRLSFLGYAAVTFALVQLMFLGITLYLHRDQSHGGLVLHPALRHFFRFWLWFCSGTVTKEWVAVHRRHHAFADQPGDPHSPVVFGLRRVVLQGYELYGAAARDPSILANYGRGTPHDWLECNLYGRFPKTGVSLFITLQMFLFGIPAIIMIAVEMIAQPLFAGGVINGVGHSLGYRSYEIPTSATNIVPWGVLIGGEELHNNHHAFTSSPRFAMQPWEIDVGWWFIRLFRALGLAQVHSLAPVPHMVADRSRIDADTVRALFTNRMHVLRDYRRRVVRPVFRDWASRKGAGMPARRSSKLLVRHPDLLDDRDRQRRRELLDSSDVLRSVLEFRDHLQESWDDGSASPGRAVFRLRELCAGAEASGITALREFALSLRAYVPASGT